MLRVTTNSSHIHTRSTRYRIQYKKEPNLVKGPLKTLGGSQEPAGGDIASIRCPSLARDTIVRAVVLSSSCLGPEEGVLLRASLAFFLDPHKAVTLIFLHLSCFSVSDQQCKFSIEISLLFKVLVFLFGGFYLEIHI